MQNMMHHGQQFGGNYGPQRGHPGPNMHPAAAGMNGMGMMNPGMGPMHGNMMPSGVMGPTSGMGKMAMQVIIQIL